MKSGRKENAIKAEVLLDDPVFEDAKLVESIDLAASRMIVMAFGIRSKMTFDLPIRPQRVSHADRPMLDQDWREIEESVTLYVRFKLAGFNRSTSIDAVVRDIACDAIIRYVAAAGRSSFPPDFRDKIKAEAGRIIRLRVDRKGAFNRSGEAFLGKEWGMSHDAGEVVPSRWAITRLSGKRLLLRCFETIMSGEVFTRELSTKLGIAMPEATRIRRQVLATITANI